MNNERMKDEQERMKDEQDLRWRFRLVSDTLEA